MTTYTFDRIEARGFKKGKCAVCGKSTERLQTFWMTDNPWNKNADGTRRSIPDIRRALGEQVAAWQAEPITHAKCEAAR